MDHHIKLLENLCRLCGGKIKLSKSYCNAKNVDSMKKEILQVYGMDCSRESAEIYPNLLCHLCVRKLRLDFKHDQQSEKKTAASFDPHDDDHCTTCSKEHQKHKMKTKATLHRNILTGAFHDANFKKIIDEAQKIMFCSFTVVNSYPSIELAVEVDMETGNWTIVALGKKIPGDLLSSAGFGFTDACLNDQNVRTFLEELLSFKVCHANPNFKDLVQKKVDANFRDPFPTNGVGTSSVHVESDRFNVQLTPSNFGLIRHPDCTYLVSKLNKRDVCNHCFSLGVRMRKQISRAEAPTATKPRVSDSSSTNVRHLTRDELEERLRNSQKSKRQAVQKAVSLSLKIKQLLEKEGVQLQEDHSSICAEVLQKETNPFDEESPQWLLWQQQMEMASKKDRRGMRWHPLIIRWCLSIYHTSPAAYKQIASTNFMVLPHFTTLKKFTNFTDPKSGFNKDVLERLMEENDWHEEYKKNVCIVFDEMKVKSDLVYNRGTGQLIGFTDMGDVNEEMREFVDHCEGKKVEDRSFAKYVNVFMARGLFSNVAYPFGYYASTGLTSDQLYPCTLKATQVLESLGLKVRAWVSDGASPNRKFFKICSKDGDYWTWNPFNRSRKIFFISDVPHLMKTTRNNMENSHGNKNTRNLHHQGQDISWNHIVSCYERDLQSNRTCPGLRKLHKLTEEHIRLSPRLRMKVKYAVQVLSATMVKALEAEDNFYTVETRNFISRVDKVFDCLNGMRSTNYGKPERAPYRHKDDERFQFLYDFLKYLEDWKKEVTSHQNMTKEEQAKMMLSSQTVSGWKMTINSFVELTKELLDEDGVCFFLSEKLSQDPLEEHFGKQRRRGGCNENPTYQQFQRNELLLNVMGSNLLTEIRGNTIGRDKTEQKIDIHDDRRLPTRKRSK